MRATGILRSWNDERGFGFIAPTQGGAELFVHISALPRDGSRPVVGETADELADAARQCPHLDRVAGMTDLGQCPLGCRERRRELDVPPDVDR